MKRKKLLAISSLSEMFFFMLLKFFRGYIWTCRCP